MSILKARFNNAWIDTALTGSVRYQDTTINYGPSGGPSYEAVDWTAEPVLTDASDSTTYSMGCSFTVLQSKPCYGVRWRVPDSVTTPPVAGAFYATLWQISPTVKLKQVVFTPTPGQYQDILFSAPEMLSNTENYLVSVLTVKYVFRSAASVAGFPKYSPSGNVVVDNGRLAESPDPDQVPGGTFPSIYYVSPLVGT